MSQENVDLVKRQIGDVDLAAVLRDDVAWEERLNEIEPLFAADFEFVVVAQGQSTGGRGFAEYRALFLDWIEPWETYLPGIEEIIDLGDQVVVLGRDRGRMKGMNREIEGPKGLVHYTFESGRVTLVTYYFDRNDGLRAAGLAAP